MPCKSKLSPKPKVVLKIEGSILSLYVFVRIKVKYLGIAESEIRKSQKDIWAAISNPQIATFAEGPQILQKFQSGNMRICDLPILFLRTAHIWKKNPQPISKCCQTTRQRFNDWVL
jgi:hypothetical protein